MAWKHRTVAMEHQILALSKAHPQKQVARLVGCSAWTVFDVQRKYHWVAMFGRHHVAARRYAYDEHAWGTILEALYVDQRLPIEEVAARCGVHRDTIRRRLVALGFRIRPVGETNRGRKRPRQSETWRAKLPRCREGCGRGTEHPSGVCAACRRRSTVQTPATAASVHRG